MKTLLTAKWIATVSGPLLEDGAIVILHGRVLDIGPRIDVSSRHRDAAVRALGNVLVTPGLINAHTHLELSDARRDAEAPVDFVHWLRRMIARGATGAANYAAQCASAARVGVSACLSFGVTCVGDITAQPAATRPVLAASRLRAVSFGEVRAMGANRARLDERIESALAWNPTWPVERLRPGISPHAPYSVELPGYLRCIQAAHRKNIPLATHLAENPAEAEFLLSQTGPLRDLWLSLPWWDANVPRYAGGPVRMAKDAGLLDHPTLLAHVNCCDDAELGLLATGHASVIYCPRTSAWFGHPSHRFRDMLNRDINVALATDSCASSPDLNLLEEARFVHRLAPELPPQTLLRMITLNAARALMWDQEIGSIEVGKHADLAVFAPASSDPLRELLETSLLPTQTLISGEPCAS